DRGRRERRRRRQTAATPVAASPVRNRRAARAAIAAAGSACGVVRFADTAAWLPARGRSCRRGRACAHPAAPLHRRTAAVRTPRRYFPAVLPAAAGID